MYTIVDYSIHHPQRSGAVLLICGRATSMVQKWSKKTGGNKFYRL